MGHYERPENYTLPGELARQAGETLEGRRERLAASIPEVIGRPVLETLGARRVEVCGEIAPVWSCDVRLIPFRRDGRRGLRHRWMRLQVTMLEGLDAFDVFVHYYASGRYRGHCSSFGVPAEDLGRFVMSLDWDGDELTNPWW